MLLCHLVFSLHGRCPTIDLHGCHFNFPLLQLQDQGSGLKCWDLNLHNCIRILTRFFHSFWLRCLHVHRNGKLQLHELEHFFHILFSSSHFLPSVHMVNLQAFSRLAGDAEIVWDRITVRTQEGKNHCDHLLDRMDSCLAEPAHLGVLCCHKTSGIYNWYPTTVFNCVTFHY